MVAKAEATLEDLCGMVEHRELRLPEIKGR